MDETDPPPAKEPIAPIAFPVVEEEPGEPSRLDAEREKHKQRAEKFGTDYREPELRQDLRQDARKERFRRAGFATGIDLFTSEEVSKREQRAARFGLEPGSGLQYQPPVVSEDAEKRRQRAERFGVEYQPPDETGLMDVDLFEQRRDVMVEVPRRPEAVHVYGVDLMSTADCMRYFGDYGPTYVEWINDSSCNVTFADGPTAKRAIVGLGKALPAEEMRDMHGMDASDPANLAFLWHKGEDFVKAGTPIPLLFRIATMEDVKPEGRVASRRLWQSAAGGAGQPRRQRRQQQRNYGAEEEGGEGEMGAPDSQVPGLTAGLSLDETIELQRRLQQQRRRGGGRRGGGGDGGGRKRRLGDADMADAEEGGGGRRGRRRRQATGGLFNLALKQAGVVGGEGGAGAAAQGAAPGGGGEAAMPEREAVDYGDL